MFLDECAQQFNDILSEVLRGLQPTPDDAPKIKKRRAEIMVQLINVLVSITDFSANKSSLIVMKKLLKEVNEYYGNSEFNDNFCQRTMEFLKLKSNESDEAVTKKGLFGKQREALRILLSKSANASVTEN